MYIPKPIDTDNVHLDAEILSLAEKIAENVHENWAAARMSEGWKYGIKRDDQEKTTPCLVPYSELTEEEKEYDRNTALETLKVMIKLGYKFVKNSEG